MSAARRRALVAFAREHDAVVVEDDYDGEFRYEGNPLQALRSADAADVVFYVGTFSKCMLPALRLGFLVAPPWALGALVTAKNALDWHAPTPLQLGVASFIETGRLGQHVRAMRRRYRERREAAVSGLREQLDPWLEALPSTYGMHVAALARPGVDVETAADVLLRADVRLHTLRRYYVGPPDRTGIVLGFGAADVGAIRRGLGALRAALTG
jgi:GntR family transcriptional regulator/MocR family aminotransferase